jgi:putative copper export protein
VLAIGPLAFHFLVLPRLPAEWRGGRPVLELHAARIGLWAVVALIAVAPVRLALQARGFIEPTDPVMPMALNVLGTTWGRALIAQLVGALVALAGFVLAWRAQPLGWRTAVAGLIVIALGAAFMGHPVTNPRTAWVSVPLDLVHVASVGAWIGTLAVLTRISLSADIRSEGGGTIATLVGVFHPVALWSASVVVASGTVVVILRVDHLRSLLTSDYGTVLFVKLGAVLAVACLGAYNSKMAIRRARNGQVRSAMATLLAESCFAVFTVGVTAVLVATDPPSSM